MLNKSLWTIIFTVGLIGFSANSFAKRPPWLGVQLGYDAKGVMLNGVFVDSAAEKAGMQPGDVVTHIGGAKVSSPKQFSQIVGSKNVGQALEFRWAREGKAMSKVVSLIPKPNEVEVLKNMHMNKKLDDYALKILEFIPQEDKPKGWFSSLLGGSSHAGKGEVRVTDTSLSSFAGKALILKFWATWCPACLSTHGKLNAFSAQAKNIAVLAITTQEESVVREFMLSQKPRFKIVLDVGGKIQSKWPISSIPAFVVADKSHKVRMIEKGAGRVVDLAIAKASE